jgi:predicted AAA+ superfamily ATPase
VNEIAKQATWADEHVRLHHYRDRDGAEVDLVLENARGQVVGIEVKASMSPGNEAFRHLRKLRAAVGDDFLQGIVLHLGDDVLPFGDRMTALPVGCLWRH